MRTEPVTSRVSIAKPSKVHYERFARTVAAEVHRWKSHCLIPITDQVADATMQANECLESYITRKLRRAGCLTGIRQCADHLNMHRVTLMVALGTDTHTYGTQSP